MMGIVNLEQIEQETEADIKQHNDQLDNELADVQESKEIPEKYRGKSLEDVIAMHEAAERKASRLGNEIGQLRQYRNQLELQPQKRPEKKEVNVDALLENPEEAVETIVSQSSEVRKLRETVEHISTETAKRNFESQFPTYNKDLESQDFIDWALANPVRKALAQAADQYDYTAATELWSLWKERQDLVSEVEKQKVEQRKARKEKELQDGTLESGTGNSTETKKVFSRREIRDLKTRALLGDQKAQDTVNDPAWQKAVNQAYMEKRVR